MNINTIKPRKKSDLKFDNTEIRKITTYGEVKGKLFAPKMSDFS
uniref:Uncharacterized protein n=1 Tax=Aliivibrio wodanis TaxID=80852 RepID=A0A5Q4ZY34_9GAMM|nr:hypothetical protein AW0309160_04264 [Aliivibrio wodanis]